MSDKNNMMRVGQRLTVEYRSPHAVGATGWMPIWEAEVIQVTLNAGEEPNTAQIAFPRLRWNSRIGLGNQIRIRTSVPTKSNGQPLYRDMQPTVLFQGFVLQRAAAFDGGDEKDNTAFERSEILCADYRWHINQRVSVFGQLARGVEDMDFQATAMYGRRAIFNESGSKNRAAMDYNNPPQLPFPIFGKNEYWTARQMLEYLLAFDTTRAHITDFVFSDQNGLEQTPHHVIVDTLPVVSAMMRVLGPLGWTMREQYTMAGPVWVFYKAGRATQTERCNASPTIFHNLYAPAPGEKITWPVEAGKKMVKAARFVEDMTALINAPVGIGSRMRFEATFDLVPGWIDSDLVPDSANNYSNVFVKESDIQQSTSPDDYSFYKKYHVCGSEFMPDVGRKWVLNEAGDYTGSPYNRGPIFDFSRVLPTQYVMQDGRPNYGPFKRRFLDCLTYDQSNINSVGIKAELSLDFGETWQDLGAMASLRNLPNECGIRIEDPNLSEILDKQARAISGGSLANKELNYWTSLADDNVNSRTLPNWRTRVRVTASVLMDQRMYYAAAPAAENGCPFYTTAVYDYSSEYAWSLRTPGSVFEESGLPAWNTDDLAKMQERIDALRDANQDRAVSGPVVLDRLWLGDGSGLPDILVGDCIAGFEGREYVLTGSQGGGRAYPEVAQIIFDHKTQRQILVLRDSRFARIRFGM